MLITSRLYFDDAVTERQRDGVSSVHGAKLAHRGLNVFIDRPFGDVENLADLQADLPFATQRKTSISRAVSLPLMICRLGKKDSRFRWHFHRLTGWTKPKNHSPPKSTVGLCSK